MNTSDAHYIKRTKTPVSRLVVILAIPAIISMLITNIYNIADTYFVGKLGISQQGACSVLFTLQTIIQAIAFMLGHGSGAYVSKHLADKNINKASKYVSTAFFVGVGLSSLLMIFGLLFLEDFLYFLGSTDTILPYAKDYGFWVLLSCPFLVGSLVLNNNLRYEGKAFYAMFGLVSGGLLNILGDYLLINKFGLGVYGAGLSTAISQLISFTILLIVYIKMAQSKISLKYISVDAKEYLEIFKVGLPSLLRQGLASISNGLLINLVNQYEDVAVSSIGNINRYSSLVMCVGLGVGQGFQPVASFNYQAKEYERVRKSLLFTLGFGFIFVTTLAITGFVLAEPIANFLQEDPLAIPIATKGIRIASIGVVFLSISVPVNMLYQSIRKSTIASFLSLLRSGLTFIPVLLLLSYFFQLNGILWAQAVSDILSAIICAPFIFHFLISTKKKELKYKEKIAN